MKKVLRSLITSIAVLSLTVTTAFAAPSVNVNGSVVGDVIVNGEKVDAEVSFTNNFTNVESSVKEVINKINEGQNLDEILADVKVEGTENLDLIEYSLLTTLQDLVAVDANGNKLKNVTITWEVPNLVEGLGDVKVLHYSTERKVWEVIDPSNVDFANKTITATFQDLSPVGVIYKAEVATNGTVNDSTTADENNKETLPETGDVVSSTHVALAALVLVAAGSALYLGRRKKATK